MLTLTNRYAVVAGRKASPAATRRAFRNSVALNAPIDGPEADADPPDLATPETARVLVQPDELARLRRELDGAKAALNRSLTAVQDAHRALTDAGIKHDGYSITATGLAQRVIDHAAPRISENLRLALDEVQKRKTSDRERDEARDQNRHAQKELNVYTRFTSDLRISGDAATRVKYLAERLAATDEDARGALAEVKQIYADVLQQTGNLKDVARITCEEVIDLRAEVASLNKRIRQLQGSYYERAEFVEQRERGRQKSAQEARTS